MRALLAALLIALSAPATAQVTPPSAEKVEAIRAKFADYVAAGWPPERAAEGVQRWFGYVIETSRDTRGTDVLITLRTADGRIYYLETIGNVPNM